MKFLKTFLFTISLTFISFGVVTFNGFCQALPQLDPSSLEVIQGTNRNDAFVGFSPEMSVYMIDEIYNNINQNMYDAYGYDLEDVANESEQISYEIMTGQRPSLTSNNYISSATMDWIASKSTKATVNTMAALISAGYKIYGQVYPQWGRNIKQFFVGKENNGVISDVTTTVKYFTDEGFNNYASMLDEQIQDGYIRTNQNDSVYVDKFRGTAIYSSNLGSNSLIYYEIEFSKYYVLSSSPDTWNDNHIVYIYVPLSDITYMGYQGASTRIAYFNASGKYVRYGGIESTFTQCKIRDYSEVVINGITYLYGPLCLSTSDYWCLCRYAFGSLASSQNILAQNNIVPSSMGFSYTLTDSNGNPNQISLLLKSLVGRYVDSDSLSKVTEIIREVPVIPVTDGQGNTVVQAQPTTDNISELTSLINQIIEDDAKWKEFLPEPEIEPEPEPYPDPLPDQGTTVPDGFPTAIFSPINDSIGGVFDLVSIFEPLFYIFSFSSGLLGLWFVIPFVILFLILFRLLK